MSKKTIDYIRSGLEEQKRKTNTLFGRDIVLISHPLPDHINLDSVLRRVEIYIPSVLASEVDAIYIGDFKLLKARQIKAYYYHGAIYLSNEQDNENDIFNDLLHEIAHAIETLLRERIYADGSVEKEFLQKREQMLDILDMAGYNVSVRKMLNPDYDLELDSFFYNEIGYDKLAQMIGGVFVTPYSITSVREYWAKGLEHYLIGDRSDLKQVCPILYNRLEEVFTEAYEGG